MLRLAALGGKMIAQFRKGEAIAIIDREQRAQERAGRPQRTATMAKQKLRTKQRQKEIMAARLRGFTFDQIAQALHITDGACVKLYYRALREIPAAEIELERTAAIERINQHELLLTQRIERAKHDEAGIETDEIIAQLSEGFRKWELQRCRILGIQMSPDVVVNVASIKLDKLSPKQIEELKNKLFAIDPRWTLGMVRSAITDKQDAEKRAQQDEARRQAEEAAASRPLEPELPPLADRYRSDDPFEQRANELMAISYQPGQDGVLHRDDETGSREYTIDELRRLPRQEQASSTAPASLIDQYVDTPAPAVTRNDREAELHAFHTAAARGQAKLPPHHPSGRGWQFGEARVPWHLIPGYEHMHWEWKLTDAGSLGPDPGSRELWETRKGGRLPGSGGGWRG
jgi:hypothetical protein